MILILARRPKPFAALCSLLIVVAPLSASLGAPALTVVDLLRAASATGLNILYSSDLVPPTLAAPVRTSRADALSELVEALASHHLVLVKSDATHYVVTRPADRTRGPPAGAPVGPRAADNAALEEVVVFASHYVFRSEPEGEATTLDRRGIEQVAGTQNDAVRAIRAAPGVASTYSSRPYIRGGSADDVLTRFDDIALTNPFHFRAFQSLISPFVPAAVDRIDVYAGGFPVRFGTRMAGVIDIQPRSLDAGYDLRANVSRLGADIAGVGRDATLPLDWLATARSSTDQSNVLQPVDANPGEPKFFDALGRVRWQASSTTGLALGWLMLDDRARASADARDQLAAARSRDVYGWLALDWAPSGSLQSHSTLSYTRSLSTHYGALSLSGVGDGSLSEAHGFDRLELRSEWRYAPRAEVLWDFGAELGAENATLDFSQDEVFAAPLAQAFGRPTSFDVRSHQTPGAATAGWFVSARQQWRALQTEVGLRLDSQDYHGFGVRTQLAPRINARLDPAPAWHVYGSLGVFSQAQRVDEWRAQENQLTPDPASRSVHTVAGLAHEQAGWQWRAEIYRDRSSTVSPYYENVLGLVTLLPELQPDQVRIAPKSADSSGLELTIRRPWAEHLNTWGSYTLSRAIDDLAGQDVPRSWDQRHAAQFGVAWIAPRAQLSALLAWHSGWPRTPLTTAAANAMAPALMVLGSRNTWRWSSYLSLDLHAAWGIVTHLGELSLWADVANATDRSNACCTELGVLSPPATLPSRSLDDWSGRSTNVGFTWRLHKDR